MTMQSDLAHLPDDPSVSATYSCAAAELALAQLKKASERSTPTQPETNLFKHRQLFFQIF
jgi:hypothetical protein